MPSGVFRFGLFYAPKILNIIIFVGKTFYFRENRVKLREGESVDGKRSDRR